MSILLKLFADKYKVLGMSQINNVYQYIPEFNRRQRFDYTIITHVNTWKTVKRQIFFSEFIKEIEKKDSYKKDRVETSF